MNSPLFDSFDDVECTLFLFYSLSWGVFFFKYSNLLPPDITDVQIEDVVVDVEDHQEERQGAVTLARAVVALQRLKVQGADFRLSRIPKPSPAWKPKKERTDAPPSSLTRPRAVSRGENGGAANITTPVSTGRRKRSARATEQQGSEEIFQRRLEEALQQEDGALAFQSKPTSTPLTTSIARPPTGWSPVKKAIVPAEEEPFAVTKKVLHL